MKVLGVFTLKCPRTCSCCAFSASFHAPSQLNCARQSAPRSRSPQDGRTPFDLASSAEVKGLLDRAAGTQRQGLMITRELTALLEHHTEDIQKAARDAAAEAVRSQEEQLRAVAEDAHAALEARERLSPPPPALPRHCLPRTIVC